MSYPSLLRVALATLFALPLAAYPGLAQQEPERPQIGIRPGTLPVTQAWKTMKVLRVCGDPDNLPFSNWKQEGFENKIAELLARELGDSVSYLWWPHRRGFVSNTLRSAECDVIVGIPAQLDMVLTTKPYYRSTYYVVSRADRGIDISSLDDPALKGLTIGLNLIGNDYTNTPPAEALAARGVSKNLKWYSTFYGQDHQPREIIDAVIKGDVDVALVWGPLAGYYAKSSSVPLKLVALPDSDSTGLPFSYDFAIGVRHADRELRDLLEAALEKNRGEIQKILREYNIPTVMAPH